MKSRDEIIKMLDDIYSTDTHVRSKLTRRTIIDPDESVNWNIAEVNRINEEIDKERKAAQDRMKSELRIAMSDVFDYMRDQLDEDDPSPFVLKHIYDVAFENGHSGGMYEIFNNLDEYIEFVNEIDKLRRYGEAVTADGEGAGQCPLGIKF